MGILSGGVIGSFLQILDTIKGATVPFSIASSIVSMLVNISRWFGERRGLAYKVYITYPSQLERLTEPWTHPKRHIEGSPRWVSIRLWNKGGQAIRREDFDGGLPIAVGLANAQIKEVQVAHVRPPNLDPWVYFYASDATRPWILIRPLLLNRKDMIELAVGVCLKERSTRIAVHSRITGIKHPTGWFLARVLARLTGDLSLVTVASLLVRLALVQFYTFVVLAPNIAQFFAEVQIPEALAALTTALGLATGIAGAIHVAFGLWRGTRALDRPDLPDKLLHGDLPHDEHEDDRPFPGQLTLRRFHGTYVLPKDPRILNCR